MNGILREITDNTAERVKVSKERIPLGDMRRLAFSMDSNTGFPFEKALSREGISFICECKRASPSRGLIMQEYPYLEIAKEYESAGASCISVLTEPRFFLGHDDHLREVSKTVSIPCLRKDFTIDDYMIFEAKTLGASAVLLICSILDTEDLGRSIGICDDLGMSALVEAHDTKDIMSALDAGARIIGINNRNLEDFTVDRGNSVILGDMIPDNVLFVAESGITTPEDVRMMRDAGADAVLIGETLMRSADRKETLDRLRSLS
ncbi:MAG: indole-3-glycerol phosphate synthase TrpC [Candidatus Methanoplasma sp.]|jgi:indole-3-glycerol phosphate synthase|nr:indole-3-glycerol phosphate synthase TrpC [Candidatus Methanoplasma sp.]